MAYKWGLAENMVVKGEGGSKKLKFSKGNTTPVSHTLLSTLQQELNPNTFKNLVAQYS